MYGGLGVRCSGVVVLFLVAGAILSRADLDACSLCAQQLALQYSSSGPGLQASSPVCGADGFTYLHRCLAECQGVEIASDGACEGMPAMLGGAANSQAAAATAGDDEVLSSSAAAAQAPAPVLDAATITKYANEGMTCLGFLPKRAFRPTVPGITMERLKNLQQQSQGQGATVMLEVASGVMYAGGPTSRSGVAVPELTGDGSDEAEQENAGRSTGRRLHRGVAAAASVPLQQQPTLQGVRRLLQHAAAHQQQAAAAATAGHQDAAGAWDWASATADAGSGSSFRKLSGIFGKDTRTEIVDPPRDPFFSPTGHLLFKDPGTGIRYQCTGALIGPYTVLTAAHCLVTRDGVQQANIEFTAGQTFSNFSGLGTAKGLRVYFNQEFLGSQWEQHDYGILLIDRPFGLYTEPAYYAAVMDIAQIKAQETNGKPADVYKQFTLPAGWTPKRYGYAFGTAPMKQLRVMSAGYPGDKKFNSFWRLSCRVTDSNPISPVLMHRCPTMSGQSGAPLFEIRTVQGVKMRVVRAITSFEMCGSVCSGACCDGGVKYNGALRITETVKAFIDANRMRVPYKELDKKVAAVPKP